jgi:hypothetical protein
MLAVLQDSGAQVVPTAYFWQPLLPSHLPFVPHDGAPMSLHMALGSALPAGMGVHFPGVEFWLQLRQAPVHALSQQRPSTQKFD